MKIINAAYDVLKDYAGEIETEDAAGEAGNYAGPTGAGGCRAKEIACVTALWGTALTYVNSPGGSQT